MNLLNWAQLTPGTINLDGGNALKNFTSSFRRGERPQFNPATCIHCFFCWVYCPDNAIIVEDDRIAGINYDYCKGCGICVNECPVKQEKPLEMIKEEIEL